MQRTRKSFPVYIPYDVSHAVAQREYIMSMHLTAKECAETNRRQRAALRPSRHLPDEDLSTLADIVSLGQETIRRGSDSKEQAP